MDFLGKNLWASIMIDSIALQGSELGGVIGISKFVNDVTLVNCIGKVLF